jgi:hypothetical protein
LLRRACRELGKRFGTGEEGRGGTGSCENFDTGEESTVYPAVIGSCPTTRRQR